MRVIVLAHALPVWCAGEPGEPWQPAPGARRGKVEFCGASGVVACVHVWRAVVLVVGVKVGAGAAFSSVVWLVISQVIPL